MKPFKVVCIKDEIKSWTRPPSLFDQIVKGNIYTVIEIKTSSACDQVEEHINKLIKEDDLKTISV